MPLNPVEVTDTGGTGGDDKVFILCQARHRNVGFDAAPLIQHLGIDDLPHRDIDVVAADVLQHVDGIASLQQIFGHRRQIVNTYFFADTHVLSRRIIKPVLSSPAVFIFGLYAFRSKPVGPFPSGYHAKAGSPIRQAIMKGCAPGIARCSRLFKRPVIII